MRIISGKYKGITLNTLAGEHTRPTCDRVKEAIFSIIQFDIANAVVFDPFSGSGQLSIEAISRNAKFAYLNDNNNSALQIIKSNISKVGCEDFCSISNVSFSNAVLKLKSTDIIDIVFLDPPYKSDLLHSSLEIITKSVNLSDKAVIICEHSIDNIPANRYNDFILLRTYKYSKVGISLYRRKV